MMLQAPIYVLLADDDAEDAELFREALNEVTPDAILSVTTTGSRLLDMTKILTPDLIFLDINMPVMNGMDCLAALRKIPSLTEVPVIMYSTAADPSSIDQAFQAGANRYLQKPTSFAAIKAQLNEILQLQPEELMRPQHPGSYFDAARHSQKQ